MKWEIVNPFSLASVTINYIILHIHDLVLDHWLLFIVRQSPKTRVLFLK